VREEPGSSPLDNYAVILPISGAKLKFTTAGTPSTDDVYGLNTASSGLAVALSMLRSSLAL
jgi:hypothetical protein